MATKWTEIVAETTVSWRRVERRLATGSDAGRPVPKPVMMATRFKRTPTKHCSARCGRFLWSEPKLAMTAIRFRKMHVSATVQTRCSDGLIQEGIEACDDGNDPTDNCLDDCTWAGCGDGIVQAGIEACDDGNEEDGDSCLNDCTLAQCGDGVVQIGVELCDDGNDNEADDCLPNCEPNVCGDGVLNPGVEACDDGNGDSTDECTPACQPAQCGDGFLHSGVEECDDGNNINTDACLNACIRPAETTSSNG